MTGDEGLGPGASLTSSTEHMGSSPIWTEACSVATVSNSSRRQRPAVAYLPNPILAQGSRLAARRFGRGAGGRAVVHLTLFLDLGRGERRALGELLALGANHGDVGVLFPSFSYNPCA